MISEQEWKELDARPIYTLTPREADDYREYVFNKIGLLETENETVLKSSEDAYHELTKTIDLAVDELKLLQKAYPDDIQIDEIISMLQY